MTVTFVLVTSLNGKLTDGQAGPHNWASAEDQQFFGTLIEESALIVMGRATYEASKPVIQLRPGKLRVVLTNDPKKYSEQVVPGQLEFSNEKPADLVERFTKLGYEKMLVVGGSQIYTAFLEAKLVNEIYLTLEPKIFASGVDAFAPLPDMVPLQLIEARKMNENGTLLLNYSLR